MTLFALALATAWAGPAPATTAATAAEAPTSPVRESSDIEHLRRQVEALERQLAAAEARLEVLEGAPTAPGARVSERRAGARVEAGEVVPEAVSFAGPLEIWGRVDGAAVAFGGDVIVRPGAYVEGDAVSFGGRVQVDEGGAVAGSQVTFGALNAVGVASTGSVADALSAPRQPGWRRSLARRLVLVLSFAGLGVLIVGAFPRQVDTIAAALERHPVRSGLLGVGVSILGALMMSTFALTMVGAPIAVLLGGLLLAAWAMGFIGLCLATGDRLPGLEGHRRWLAFLLGIALIAGLVSLPMIGQIALALTGFICVGAAAQTRLGTSPAE